MATLIENDTRDFKDEFFRMIKKIIALLCLGFLLAISRAAQTTPANSLPPAGASAIRETNATLMARARLYDAQPHQRHGINHRHGGSGKPIRDDMVEFPLYLTNSAPALGVVYGPFTNLPGPLGSNSTALTFTAATLSDCNSYPPDTMGAVGPAQFIVAVNGRLRSFNKTTGQPDGVLDTSMDSFFNSVMTPPANNNFTSDPRIRYDRLTGRWFILIIDVPGRAGILPNRVLIAVSDSSVITGGTVWSFFQFQHDLVTTAGDTGKFADYPTLGIDVNALYIGVNVFNTDGSFFNTTAFVVQKSSITNSGPIVVTAFRNLIGGVTGPYTPQGVDNYDPAATTGYIIGVDASSSTRLRLRRVTNPGSGTPTISGNVSITVSSFASPLTVSHLSGTTALDGLDERLLAAHYRNGNIWTAHNVGVNSSGTSSSVTRNGVRWYQLQNVSGSPSVLQSGTVFDSSSTNRFYWMGSIMVSGQNHAALGFSTASASEFVNAAASYRLASDSSGTMRAPVLYTAANTAYNAPYNRWGDYSYTSLDPADDMTMWTVQQFCNSTDSYGVQVARLLAPPPALPTNCSPNTVTQGVAGVNITLTGSPANGAGFFDPGAGFSNRLAAAVNGGGITLNSVTYNNATSLTLNLTIATNATTTARTITVTNPDGQFMASSSAILNVVIPGQPPVITNAPLAQTIQCGSNATFTVAASGNAPLKFQWSLDGSPVTAATNATLTLTNVHLPNHTVAVTVTNSFGSATTNVTLTVQDTLAPVVTLNGAALLTNELGATFTDLGATATDLCAGALTVTTNGTVNINSVGTNTLTYKATDGNGNTNTATRTVIVRDTTPPLIVSSFTNLIVAANSNCVALLTNLTGTNFIVATDLSGALTITQLPTNNFILSLGTNVVVLTVADASANKSFSTNRVIVRDQTPPVIALNGGALLTNELGSVFTDPGVTASDTCAGLVSLVTNGAVNIVASGTNLLTYTATDAAGNTNSVTRTVVVRDTTPPVIAWSFTNLVLSLDTNCLALMPDVTGTNFILASDLSGAVTISQTPTKGFNLPLGTNVVLLTVADASGNTAFSTNQIIVRDVAPPLIVSQPQSQTNFVSTSAAFSVAATACTPVSFQWFFNGAVLTNETTASLTLSNLVTGNAGNYSVVVTSSGGATTSAVAVLVVNLFASSLALTSSANPDGFKDNLIFTATITPTNSTGTIQFLTNGAVFVLQPLVAGTATSTNISTLPRGTNFIAAIYSGDGKYLPATNSLAQVVTNHPPLVSPAFYTLIAGLDLNLAVAGLATNWSDADGDALFIAAITASTNGVIVTNATPTLFYSNQNYVDDQFVLTVRDGFGGTNFQTVSIAVVPQTNATPNISSIASQPPGVTLKLNGGYGSTYVLESANDLISAAWSPVATNTLGLTGVWQFTDFGVTNNPVRFYRLKLAP